MGGGRLYEVISCIEISLFLYRKFPQYHRRRGCPEQVLGLRPDQVEVERLCGLVEVEVYARVEDIPCFTKNCARYTSARGGKGSSRSIKGVRRGCCAALAFFRVPSIMFFRPLV
jgi:hypothetical protein